MSSVVAFAKPPVTEVVFSVTFALTQQFLSSYVGLYWARIRSQFPVVQDQPPLDPGPPPMVGNGNGLVQLQFGLHSMPPLRRAWFVGENGRDLIQLQEDRFVFNWRRNPADEGYPGYQQVSQRFEEHYAEFMAFLADEGLAAPTYPLLELVYVNSISRENGLLDVPFTAAMVDHSRDNERARFLPDPAAVNSLSVYALPESTGALQIQTHSTADQVRIDITARGVPLDHSEVGRRAWFDVAHATIVSSFVDVTNAKLHVEHWRREG